MKSLSITNLCWFVLFFSVPILFPEVKPCKSTRIFLSGVLLGAKRLKQFIGVVKILSILLILSNLISVESFDYPIAAGCDFTPQVMKGLEDLER